MLVVLKFLLMFKTEKRKGKFFNDFFWLMECAEFYELSCCWCVSLGASSFGRCDTAGDSWPLRAQLDDSCGLTAAVDG